MQVKPLLLLAVGLLGGCARNGDTVTLTFPAIHWCAGMTGMLVVGTVGVILALVLFDRFLSGCFGGWR